MNNIIDAEVIREDEIKVIGTKIMKMLTKDGRDLFLGEELLTKDALYNVDRNLVEVDRELEPHHYRLLFEAFEAGEILDLTHRQYPLGEYLDSVVMEGCKKQCREGKVISLYEYVHEDLTKLAGVDITEYIDSIGTLDIDKLSRLTGYYKGIYTTKLRDSIMTSMAICDVTEISEIVNKHMIESCNGEGVWPDRNMLYYAVKLSGMTGDPKLVARIINTANFSIKELANGIRRWITSNELEYILDNSYDQKTLHRSLTTINDLPYVTAHEQ